MKTLYLMRHGETEFNVRRKIQGWCDSPLTEKGIKQAESKRAIMDLQGILYDHAYSSTSERACDTLEIMTDLPYRRLKDLKEIRCGIYEGESIDLLPFDAVPDDLIPYTGGETLEEVETRVYKAIDKIMKQEDHHSVLVVSHGTAIQCFLNKIGVPSDHVVHNCAVCKIEYDGTFYYKEII